MNIYLTREPYFPSIEDTFGPRAAFPIVWRCIWLAGRIYNLLKIYLAHGPHVPSFEDIFGPRAVFPIFWRYVWPAGRTFPTFEDIFGPRAVFTIFWWYIWPTDCIFRNLRIDLACGPPTVLVITLYRLIFNYMCVSNKLRQKLFRPWTNRNKYL